MQMQQSFTMRNTNGDYLRSSSLRPTHMEYAVFRIDSAILPPHWEYYKGAVFPSLFSPMLSIMAVHAYEHEIMNTPCLENAKRENLHGARMVMIQHP